MLLAFSVPPPKKKTKVAEGRSRFQRVSIAGEVTYGVEMNKFGMPQARELATLDGKPPGPPPASVAKARGVGGWVVFCRENSWKTWETCGKIIEKRGKLG